MAFFSQKLIFLVIQYAGEIAIKKVKLMQLTPWRKIVHVYNLSYEHLILQVGFAHFVFGSLFSVSLDCLQKSHIFIDLYEMFSEDGN